MKIGAAPLLGMIDGRSGKISAPVGVLRGNKAPAASIQVGQYSFKLEAHDSKHAVRF
jgi:hypothetical protein